MKANRIKISNEATNKLRYLKSRTGLTPNILLRVGFCMSLNEKSVLKPTRYREDGMELNRYTLTGEYDVGYITLLKEWLNYNNKKVDNENMKQYFKAHLNRGAEILSSRVKSLIDLVLIAKE